ATRYSTTSDSLRPEASMSRTWFFRSIARGACESSRVWFWHTRQRSSCASFETRASSTGSAATGCASPACARLARTRSSIAMNLAMARELPCEGQDTALDEGRRERAHVLVAHHALRIDEERFRHAIDSPVDARPAFGIERRGDIGIAVAMQPCDARVALVLVVEAVDRELARAGQRHQVLVLGAARGAPRSPHVEQVDLAAQAFGSDDLSRGMELRQREAGRGLAHERRRQLARVEREAHAEESREHREDREGNPEGTPVLHRQSAIPGAVPIGRLARDFARTR